MESEAILMSRRRVLDHDPLTGTTRYFTYDEVTGEFGIQTEQDVTDVLDLNKHHYNSTDERARYNARGKESPTGARVASIPLAVLPELEKLGLVAASGQILDQKGFRKWLNDSENLAFRTRPGRV